MGAIFYSYSNNNMFKTSVSSSTAPAFIEIFNNLVNKDNMCIITQIGINITDTVQFFHSFDDFIHYYWFGKGVGQITISGMLFMNCDTGDMPGVKTLLTIVGQNRGKEIKCGLGTFGFTGVMTDCRLDVVSEPETMVQFSLNLAMISHTLNTPPPIDPKC